MFYLWLALGLSIFIIIFGLFYATDLVMRVFTAAFSFLFIPIVFVVAAVLVFILLPILGISLIF